MNTIFEDISSKCESKTGLKVKFSPVIEKDLRIINETKDLIAEMVLIGMKRGRPKKERANTNDSQNRTIRQSLY